MSASVLNRKSIKEQIKSKGKALSWVRKRVEKLQEENERLAYQHQLVADLCKVFDWFRHMQLHALQPDPELMLGDDASQQLAQSGMQQQQFTDILQTQAELQLLQQLSSLSVTQQSSSNCSAALAATAANSSQYSSNRAYPASSCQLVAPPDDAMWLVKQVLQQPWPQDCPSIDKVTVPALVEHFRATAHALSLQLVQLDACDDAAEQAESLRKVQAVLLPHLRVIVELCSSSHGRHLLGIVYLTNMETGKQLLEPDTQRIARVTDSLQLSKQQQRNIAQGAILAYRLNNPLLEELKELQLQQGGECAHPIGESCTVAADGTARPCHSGTCSAGTASGTSDARASCHSEAAAASAAAMDGHTAGAAGASAAGDAERAEAYSEARRQSLLRQEQRSAKMKRLMGKGAFLRVCFASYLYGQLTWVQLARLFALMFPRYPMPNLFFSAVAAKVAREQQQQQ